MVRHAGLMYQPRVKRDGVAWEQNHTSEWYELGSHAIKTASGYGLPPESTR